MLDKYHNDDNGRIRVSRQQASAFAKDVAGDFNPIHDPDSKRFCVPGDLLFALVLEKYGLSQHMRFEFSGLVGDGVTLNFPDSDSPHIDISDDKGKRYLSIERSGDISTDPSLVLALTVAYVEFSGQTFPQLLVPLMAEHGVMINPDRPLVIYQSMAITLNRLDIGNPELELTGSGLEVNGKRGLARLGFRLTADGETIGEGEKSMVLSGLRPFEAERVERLVDGYLADKQAYLDQRAS
ncbi:MAG TPA: DUF3581 family protein [Gammaproteobacteria bacterium]|nr:DUF3581 family protein [Gammaproteobacteria bacterium]